MNEQQAKQLSDVVRQTAFELQCYLRHGHLERVYETGLVNRLLKKGLRVQSQRPIKILDEDGSPLGEYVADLLVEGGLLVELKAVRALNDEHAAQVLGYLRGSRIEHGLLINFGAPRLQVKKYILRVED